MKWEFTKWFQESGSKDYTTFGVSRMLDSCCVDYTEKEKLTY